MATQSRNQAGIPVDRRASAASLVTTWSRSSALTSFHDLFRGRALTGLDLGDHAAVIAQHLRELVLALDPGGQAGQAQFRAQERSGIGLRITIVRDWNSLRGIAADRCGGSVADSTRHVVIVLRGWHVGQQDHTAARP
jgi:hypothetical protein